MGLALLTAMGLAAFASPSGALASTAGKSGPTLQNLNITEDTQATPPVNKIETNNITVSLAGGNYTINDAGADITAGAGCTSVNAHQVTCASAGVTRVFVRAGDLNDTVRNTAPDPATGCPALANCITLDGGLGSDTLTGSGARENLIGTDQRLNQLATDSADGNDTMDGGFANDFIMGGPGADTVSYATRTAPVTANLGACVPTSACGFGGQPGEQDAFNSAPRDIENLIGGSGDDNLIGSESANVIRGGAGADRIWGSLQVDTVDYSDRSDGVTVTVGNNGATPPSDSGAPAGDDGNASDGPAGARDNVHGDIENVIGGAGDDSLTGNDPSFSFNPLDKIFGNNDLSGGGGDDLLDGAAGADLLQGGGGNDTVTYENRTTAVIATIDGAADDGGAEDVDPESGQQDSIQDDVENVLGGSSDDTLRGSSIANALTGGPGNDLLNGGDSDDALSGGSGDDTLEGGAGNDSLAGGENNDRLVGGDGADGLDGGPSDDLLDGGAGPDSIGGGDGNDRVFYSERLNPVAASADGVAGDGELGESDNIGGDVEGLSGGADNDVLVGNGGDGLIDGGPGDDVLDGGGGADTFIGGDGRDTASYASRAAGVTVDLDAPSGDGQPGENDDIQHDVEKVEGGAGNDTLLGDAGSKTLFGGPGDDFVDGRDGVDQLSGGPGNDTVEGGEGPDVINGDDGNDVLKGEFGDDTLSGGGGDDSLNGGAGVDTLGGDAGSDLADYSATTKAASVSLDGSANDGEGREGDFVRTDVENVSTGSGNDFINSRDGIVGRVSCGRGTDRVATDPDDRVAGDCEVTVEAASARCTISGRAVKMSSSGTVKVRVTCPFEAKGTLTLSSHGRLGRKRFTISRASSSKTVKVRLSSKGKRTVRRRNRLRVKASVVVRSELGVSSRSSTTRRITIGER